MRLAFIAMVTGLLVATALAQEDHYPPEVRAVLDEARKYCSGEGGERVEFDRTTVRKVELTGRGRGDYIIDHTYTKCVEREYAFCGSGGCELAIVVAKRGGGYVRVFSQHVNAYDIEGRRGARTIASTCTADTVASQARAGARNGTASRRSPSGSNRGS